MKRIKITLSLCLLMLLLPVFTLKVLAAVDPIKPVDTGKTTQLTLQYLYGTEKLSDAPFQMYRVGDITKAGAFRFDEPFKSVYDPKDSWSTVAAKMKQEAEREEEGHNKVAPLREGVTDANGVIVFKSETNDRLSTGVYLIVGGDITNDETGDEYSAPAFLVSLPTFVGENHNGTTDDVWNYSVVAAPKAAKKTDLYVIRYNDNRAKINNTEVTDMPLPPDHEETFTIRSDRLHSLPDPLAPYVKKGTSGENSQLNSFELIYAEPKAEGYTFQGWNTNPDATDGYSTIEFDPDIHAYDVHAIWKANENPGTDDPGTDDPGTDDPGTTDPSTTDPSTTDPDTDKPADKDNTQKKDPILPQTGVLWWPVPVLAILGFVLFMLGAFVSKKNSSKKNGSGSGLMLLVGIVCVSSALCLVLYNGWDDIRAGSDASDEYASVMRILPDPYNESDDARSTTLNTTEMPVKRVHETDFVGVLSIPSLSLELPVRNEWSYPGLRRSPCRYAGSAYTDDLVICGHNYTAHFGKLRRLTKGSEVVVTAMNGDEFRYKVEEVTELAPTDISGMKNSGYDLTLFTCTIGGGRRVTVRCSLVNCSVHDARTIVSEYILF